MAQQRYIKNPEIDRMPKGKIIINADPELDQSIDKMQARRAELSRLRSETTADLDILLATQGRKIAVEGADIDEVSWEISRLEGIIKSLEAAIRYVDQQLAKAMRVATWHRTR